MQDKMVLQRQSDARLGKSTSAQLLAAPIYAIC